MQVLLMELDCVKLSELDTNIWIWKVLNKILKMLKALD